MPTYEYHCDAFGNHFDEFQSMSEEPLKKCPKCRKNKLRRVFGAGAAILFKGSGFYQTDYRSESYKAAAKADEPKTSSDKTATNGASSAGGGEKGKKTGKTGAKSPKSES